jgi:hypothetical protein
MSILSETTKKVEAFYKADKPDHGFLLHQLCSTSYSQLVALKEQTKRNKLHIKSIDICSGAGLPFYHTGATYEKGVLAFVDKSGIFKITFSDDTFMYYARWFSGSKFTDAGFITAERAQWIKFLKLGEVNTKANLKVKSGIYYVTKVNSPGGAWLSYTPLKKKDLTTLNIVHPGVQELRKDLEFFFNNVSMFTRYNAVGCRKSMLVGEPGTGKTSLCLEIAREYSGIMPVVIATDVAALAMHTQRMAKRNEPSIAILEDAEATFSNTEPSTLLNFLDGVLQPVNKGGTYILMTTNHPERIEPRILKRPGRVDKVISIGMLKDKWAQDCAMLYFKDFFTESEIYSTDIFNDMTGAQIKELSLVSASHAVSNATELTMKVVMECKILMGEGFLKVDEFRHDVSSLIKPKKVSVGFQYNSFL